MQVEYLKKYFLGLLDREDLETVEVTIIEEPESEETLAQAENELIEDYLENALTQEETKAFEANYLNTDERRLRVAFLRLLKRKAVGFEAGDAERPGFLEKVGAVLTLRPVALALGAVVLIAAIGITWRLVIDNSDGPLQAEIAALNKKDLSDLGKYRNLKTISLVSGNLRSTDASGALSKQEFTDQVLFRLALQNLADSKQIYTIMIYRNGKNLQNITQPSINNQEVRILLPKEFLTKGEYQITLESGAEKLSYYFSVG